MITYHQWGTVSILARPPLRLDHCIIEPQAPRNGKPWYRVRFTTYGLNAEHMAPAMEAQKLGTDWMLVDVMISVFDLDYIQRGKVFDFLSTGKKY